MAEKTGRAKLVGGAIILVAVTGFAGWQHYHSPNQVAARQLKQATQAKAAGRVPQAAELFAEVAQSRSDAEAEGAAGLGTLLDAAVLRALPPADAARVLSQVPRARSTGQSPMPLKKVTDLGWTLIEHHGPKDAAGAKAILDAMAPMENDKARLAAAAEPLLERIVAASPANAAAAIEYAELLDRRRDCSRCEALLAPHAAALGRGEGARILGQIYAAKGRFDESYALLQPYTEEALKLFVKRETEYREAGAALEKEVFETLRAGKAPADFYKRYDAADEPTKREMVSSYVNEQLSGNARLKALTQALRESAAIVPAALDLGIVTVQRAQKLSDPAARNVQFQHAEKVFLSIRGMAGDNDSYRLYLGQVYYWLGKQDEGKKLFDELLAAHGREYAILCDVAGLLRSIGAVQEARTLVEEAYGKAKDDERRWAAAHLRSVMQIDPEDELVWLERSDRSHARVRASIHTTRAQLAERQGQRATAKREYERAATEFSKLPESAVQLNSSALVHLALYAMEGDPHHRDLGLAQLDQALALTPADSILLLNNVSAVSSAAAAAILGSGIDLPLLQTAGDFRMLEFLHNDEASRERVRRMVRDSEAVKKALSYSEKAALLAPRNPESYVFPAMISSLLEDAAAMKQVAARAQASQLDLADARRQMQKLVAGPDPKQLEAMATHTRQSAALLQQPALQRQPATWAVAAGRWVDAQIALAVWGQAVDADAVVKLARKARAGQASAGTTSMLMEALELRAALRLMKANASFANAVARHGRVIDLSTLMVLHIDEDLEFRRQALADADLAEVMALLHDRDRRYPSKSSTWAWLLFRHADAAYAQSLATRLRQDAAYAAQFQLRAAIEPANASTVVARYHYALANGDRSDAQRILDEARKAGIALPEVLGRQLKV